MAVAQGDLDTALGHARALLDPLQRLPDALAGTLEVVLAAGDVSAAGRSPQHALDPAHELGYL